MEGILLHIGIYDHYSIGYTKEAGQYTGGGGRATTRAQAWLDINTPVDISALVDTSATLSRNVMTF